MALYRLQAIQNNPGHCGGKDSDTMITGTLLAQASWKFPTEAGSSTLLDGFSRACVTSCSNGMNKAKYWQQYLTNT